MIVKIKKFVVHLILHGINPTIQRVKKLFKHHFSYLLSIDMTLAGNSRLLKHSCKTLIISFNKRLYKKMTALTLWGNHNGVDIELSPSARKLIPWSIEAKRQEKISLHTWWNQAKANCKEGTKPVIITKQNNKEPLVIMSLEDFMNLLWKHF